MNREKLFEIARNTYGIAPEYPWNSAPNYAVLRHSDNRKWFAVIMNVSKRKLGISSDEAVDIINLKCDPLMIGSLLSKDGIYRAYHMNKTSWISVILDSTVDDDTLLFLLTISFDLTSSIKK